MNTTERLEAVASTGQLAEQQIASPEGQKLVGQITDRLIGLIDDLLAPGKAMTGEDALFRIGQIQGMRLVVDGLYGPIQLGRLAAKRLTELSTPTR